MHARVKKVCVSAVLVLFSSLLSDFKALPARELLAARPSPLTQPINPLDYYQRTLLARELFGREDFATAEPLYERLTREYPLDWKNWSHLATVKRRLGKCAEAIPAYQRAIDLTGPHPGQSRYWIAACHSLLGNRQAALDTLEKLVFEDAELFRPTIADAPEFAAIKDDPRLKIITGRKAMDRIGRDESWRVDLDHLVTEIQRVSPSHRHRPLPAATASIYQSLRADIPRLTDEQIFARLAQLVGTLDQNHSFFGAFGPYPESERPRVPNDFLPVRFYAFPEGLFVVAANAAHRDLIGARLLAIDSTPVEEAFRKVATAVSAAGDAEAYWTAPQRLSETHLLAGLGVAKNSSRIRLQLQGRNGHVIERTLASTRTDLRGKLPPPDGAATPLFLARVRESHWLEVRPQQAIAYVQVNQIAPDPEESLPEFGLRFRQVLADNPAIRNVVLDLRHNNGGNSFTYPELLRTLIAFSTKPGNRLYVLIGRNVYSAAANFTTDLERLANPIFIGEPTGNTGNQVGDEAQVMLPFSGLKATIGGVLWQLSHPWDKRTSIVPDVPVQLTAADYFAGRDPVLETVERMISGTPAN